jgi:hypothetical protein
MALVQFMQFGDRVLPGVSITMHGPEILKNVGKPLCNNIRYIKTKVHMFVP